MRKLFTVLILITRVCLGEPVDKPVLKRTAAAKKEQPAPTLPPRKPDIVMELIAPQVMPLDAIAAEALKIGQEMRADPVLPVRGPYGSVLYAYGRGEPALVCAPMRVCFVELQPGERLVGEPYLGDTIRWEVWPGLYGGEEEGSAVLIIKARDANVETNMVFMTNRRPYSVRLISRTGDYVARVAFKYPEDEAKKWEATKASVETKPKIVPAILPAEKWNFAYRVKGGDDHTRPIRVFDDLKKTYIVMPATMRSREAPALMVVDDDGKQVMSNYRVSDNGTYVVDRLFSRAQLRLGTSKKSKKVDIFREGS